MGVDYGKLEAYLPVQKEEDFHSALAKKLGISREEVKRLALYYSTRNKGGKDGEEQGMSYVPSK